MADTTLDTDDIAAVLTAFAISLTAALTTPGPKTGDRILETLANELDDFSKRSPGTPASIALTKTAQMLFASEPH